MSSIAASAGQVLFIPKAQDSYFFESIPCQRAVTDGYGGIRFSLQGPAGGSLAFELQTTSGCDSSEWKSSYTIITDLTGQRQTVTLPLIGFDNEPNYDAIVGLVWSGFTATDFIWTIGNITLVCGDVSAPTIREEARVLVEPGMRDG